MGKLLHRIEEITQRYVHVVDFILLMIVIGVVAFACFAFGMLVEMVIRSGGLG